ncbi:PAS domain-containing protein [Azospirillum halopraeferens]|uniref:PAS domain-containing protein n=1 Tax=Azospirillum halopraeferens TaxID=34010 RepID=UPI00042851E5|nr:PAS domain-containing protein [Azospirillum halopraeferens]
MTLLTRLFLLILLAVLPALAIQAYGVAELREQRESVVADQAERLLRLVEGEQARLIEGARQAATVVAESSFLRAAELDRCQVYLERLAALTPGHQTVYVSDAHGRILCSGAPDAVGSPVDGALFARAMETGAFTIGAFTRWPPDGRPVLPFAVPYAGPDGKRAGVVAVTLDLPWLADILSDRTLPEGASLTVADRNGIILVRLPDNAGGVGTRLPESHLRLDLDLDTALRQGDKRYPRTGVTVAPGLDGTMRVLAFTPAADNDHQLFISVGLDHARAMAEVEETTLRGLAMTLLGLVVAALAAWIGGTLFIRRPVQALVDAARDWRDGRWSARAGLGDRRSEITLLGQAFDSMAEALEARERELRAKERHLADVLDSLPAFTVVLNPEGVVLQSNRAALDMSGLAIADALGQRFDAIAWWCGDADRARLRNAVESAARGRPSRFDTALCGAAGGLRIIDFTLAPMTDGAGRITHLIASGIDITERTRTEEALRVAEARFRTALKNSGVIVSNQDRDLRYTWIHNGPADAAAVIGRTDREVLGGSPPEDVKRIIAMKRRVLATGEGESGEVCARVGGEHRYYDLTVEPLRDPAGAVVGITCAAVDVTDRRRDADAVRAAREEADAANIAKSKFLAAASHDLRQPVQSLLLFAAALGDRLRDHPSMPLLENLREALGTLKTLLDSLLDMSRLESGKIVATPAAVRLDDVLGRLAAEYAPRAREKGLELRAVRTGAWVRSDPALLERILRNLIENALRYTPAGRVLVGARRGKGTVRLEVWDTGVGIPAHQIDRIFEEFTQLDESRNERGLGLGLAIVKRLARLLGHPVTVRSVPGRGSTFAVTLPSLAAPANPREVRAVAADDPAKGMVLVIDDEAIVLLGLKAMLEGWGYDVIAACSGDQAMAMLRKDGRRPRLLLADYQLQHGRTGPQALVAIQGVVGREVPGIILTGDTTPERLAEAERNGFRVLHKPVFPNDLKKVMTAAAA